MRATEREEVEMNLTRSRARIRIGKSLLVAVVAASAMSSCITSDTESGASGGSRPVADETRPASPEGAAGLPASPATATGSSDPAPDPAPDPVPGRASDPVADPAPDPVADPASEAAVAVDSAGLSSDPVAEGLLEQLGRELAAAVSSRPSGVANDADALRVDALLRSLEKKRAGEPVLRGDDTRTDPPPSSETASLDGDPSGKNTASEEPPKASAPDSGATEAAVPQEDERPKGYVTFKTLFHKTANESIRFLQRVRPEWVAGGHVATVDGKSNSIVVFGETDGPEDPMTLKIVDILDRFDQVDLDIRRKIVKPRYIDVRLAMDALLMAGICNVWQLEEAQDALTWKEGSKTRTLSRSVEMYVHQGGDSGAAPVAAAPTVPFVYDMPRKDAFQMPAGYGGQSNTGSLVMTFDSTSSTEDRGGMMAVGTDEDLLAIEDFVESIDVPARRIMIEVQLIELDASKLTDIGIDSIQGGEGHMVGNLSLPLPGEPVVSPGIPNARSPGRIVPEIVGEGLELLFDDTSLALQSRFMATVHALVREGEAKVRARPKILTLDDRVSALHLGRDVPTFASTSVTHDSVNGNIISQVQSVTTVYAGITLHIRPRVTGGDQDRVALQIEVVDNQIVGRQQVFEQDLAGIPEVIKRQYIGEVVAHNHRPIILGGLIQEQEVESTNKLPFVGEIPVLGWLFRRTQSTSARREVIIVVTPHILSEEGVDPSATPKESMHFDTFDSVLFNDRHILKGGDVLGLDPINDVPAMGTDGKPFEEEEVIDLTLLNVIKKRELVSKLKMLTNYLSDDEIAELNWVQRSYPESTVATWSEGDKRLFFRVAAICIENVKDLNPELTFEDLTLARREIVLPTSPYNITLSYDNISRIQRLGLDRVFRGERVELGSQHIVLVHKASSHTLRAFGEFLRRQLRPDGIRGRQSTDHGELREELLRLYRGLHPQDESLADVDYVDLWRELDRRGISFVGIAAFLQANLEQRYEIEGAPDVGAFPLDLEAFLKTSVSLKQRAEKLRDLEVRWEKVNTEDVE